MFLIMEDFIVTAYESDDEDSDGEHVLVSVAAPTHPVKMPQQRAWTRPNSAVPIHIFSDWWAEDDSMVVDDDDRLKKCCLECFEACKNLKKPAGGDRKGKTPPLPSVEQIVQDINQRYSHVFACRVGACQTFDKFSFSMQVPRSHCKLRILSAHCCFWRRNSKSIC